MRQFRIVEGDALAALRAMPDESVNCCITSPPYWGLRDYGTAQWDGGDAECDHQGPPMRTNNKPSDSEATFHGGVTRAYEFYRGICGKCGARRIDAQIGLERTPDEYVARLVAVFREVRRVLRTDGTAWVNLGDSYNNTDKWGGGQNSGKHTMADNGEIPSHAVMMNRRNPIVGLKPKDLVGIPWRVAFALQADGWYLRSDIIWAKPNPMPESVTDRPTKAHEYIFLLSKSERYFYDAEAIAEQTLQPFGEPKRTGQIKSVILGHLIGVLGTNQGYVTRNRRSVWTQATQPYAEAHFATYPEELIRPCVLAGCPIGGIVLDPFAGSGTTGVVALGLDRGFIGIELSPQYAEMARGRIAGDQPLFNVPAESPLQEVS